jgi:hypothetical protein
MQQCRSGAYGRGEKMARAGNLLDKTELLALGIGREVGYADPLYSPASSAARTA